MDLIQLRCFLAAASELHFGRAAQGLGMLPAALGRHIRQLEDDLGVRLLERTTRQVSLTKNGVLMLEEARSLIERVDALALRFRHEGRLEARELRVGAIDSAAAGLLPPLLQDFRETHPDVKVHIVEDKTIRLLPRLLSGSLDLVFVRPPPGRRERTIKFQHLLFETAVVALPLVHPLATRDVVSVADISKEPLIVPDRRVRPHSHDLSIKLFAEAGFQGKISQVADEKQTIVSLVAAGIGIAIVPRWTSRLAVNGVRYVPLAVPEAGTMRKLPLSAAWIRNAGDPMRDALLSVLNEHLDHYSELA